MIKLNELDEIRQDAIQQTTLVQQERSKWLDKFIRKKQFNPGDWALHFDSKFKNFTGKFTTPLLGPYEIVNVFDNDSVKIKTIDKEGISFSVNGHRLRLYKQPVS